jgi:transcriptional regulator with XRE-family HTH domain
MFSVEIIITFLKEYRVMTETNKFEGIRGRLKTLREHLKLSREDMARHMGVSIHAYYKNETGSTIPSVKILKRLAQNDDIAMDWFLLGKGPMFFQEERDRVINLEQNLRDEQEKNKEITPIKKGIEALKKELKKIETLENRNRELENTLNEQSLEMEKSRKEREQEWEKLLQEKNREQEDLEERLKNQLAKEIRESLEPRLREELKAKQAAAAGIEVRSEVKELLSHMSRVPLLYYEVLVHLHRFKLEHPELIESSMAANHP